MRDNRESRGDAMVCSGLEMGREGVGNNTRKWLQDGSIAGHVSGNSRGGPGPVTRRRRACATSLFDGHEQPKLGPDAVSGCAIRPPDKDQD